MNHYRQIAEGLPALGLDAMLITGGPNLLYASGFGGDESMTLVSAKGCWYFTDSRYLEAARNTVTGAEVGLITAAEPYTARLNEVLDAHRLLRVGFEEQFMSVADFSRLKDSLHCELVPAQKLLTPLRSVKDEGQIEILIKAQRIAEKALDEILGFIRPGMTEAEIAAKLAYDMMRFGARGQSFPAIVVSGPNGSLPHGVPGQRKVQKGEFLTMDFGCVFEGYCSDMTRTVAVGEPDDEMKKVYNTVLEAQLAGIAAARAGVPGAAVHKAAADVIAKAGYGEYFGHGFGHGVGIQIHESPNASPMNPDPLPVGAVISAEPGIYLPGRFGVRIEDVVVIREGGCDDITLAPKNLIIL